MLRLQVFLHLSARVPASWAWGLGGPTESHAKKGPALGLKLCYHCPETPWFLNMDSVFSNMHWAPKTRWLVPAAVFTVRLRQTRHQAWQVTRRVRQRHPSPPQAHSPLKRPTIRSALTCTNSGQCREGSDWYSHCPLLGEGEGGADSRGTRRAQLKVGSWVSSHQRGDP